MIPARSVPAGTIVRELRFGVRGRITEALVTDPNYFWVTAPDAPITRGYLAHRRDLRIVRRPRQNRRCT